MHPVTLTVSVDASKQNLKENVTDTTYHLTSIAISLDRESRTFFNNYM